MFDTDEEFGNRMRRQGAGGTLPFQFEIKASIQRSGPKSLAPSNLTVRQREVLEVLAHGYLNKEIADLFGISLSTVASHLVHIFEKLQVHNRAHAVALYVQSCRGVVPSRFGLMPPDFKSLSCRQREVMELLRLGFRNKDIKAALGVSVFTVNTYVQQIYRKLQVHSRAAAVAVYSQSLCAT